MVRRNRKKICQIIYDYLVPTVLPLNYFMPETVSLVQVANVPRVREGNQSGLVENNMVQTGSYSLFIQFFSNEGRCFSG